MKRTTIPGKEGNHRYPNKITVAQKRKIFVQEYLIDFNVTRAAKAAGYSEKTAHVTGHYLLKDPKVQAAIQDAMQARIERTQVTQDRVVKELAKLAFSDMRNFARWGPGGVELKDSRTLSDEDSACVAEISQVDTQYGVNLRFKLYDKSKALEMLGRHLGMFLERHSGPDGGAIPVEVESTHEFSDANIKAAFEALYKGKEKLA